MSPAKPSLLRSRSDDDGGKVSMVELFYDLVFAFAITQLSHNLLGHLDLQGLQQAAMLLLAVWWVWINTSWVTNWLDPERIPVRLALFGMMFAGLMLSVSIPDAFGSRGLAFAVAYSAMQVGRTLFFLWAVRSEAVGMRRNFQRILVWLLASAVFWIIGGLADGGDRMRWWMFAVALEFIGPWAYFAVPGLGRSTTADWDIDGNHIAERCGLFVIICLGESLLVIGKTFAELPFSASAMAGFVSALVGSIAMWWIYFDTGAARAHHRITHSSDPGRHARLAYTYLHILIVAGVIVCAVADELVITLAGPAGATAASAILGGPALYLLGNALFKWATNKRSTPPRSHVAGLLLLAVLAVPVVRSSLSVLQLGIATTVVFLMVAVWETVSLWRARSG